MAEKKQPVVGPNTRAPLEDRGPERGVRVAMGADIRIVRDQIKVSEIDSEGGKRFEVYCDEPPSIGGDDEYPQPLHYVAAGVGFLLLTQVTRYASMLKKTIDRAECRVEFDWFLEGSVKRGTVSSGATECRTKFFIDSPESEEDVLKIVRLAKQGCFAERMVQAAVPLVSTYVINGEERAVTLEVEDEELSPP